MNAKKKVCDGCNQERMIWKNSDGYKYCQYCWSKIKHSNKETIKKIPKPIPPRSSKRINLDKEYSQLRKIYLTKNNLCQAALPTCTHDATDVHHKKGRGKHYLEVKTWMAVCRTCHQWIETHPIEATDLGFRDSKITN